VSPRAKLYGGVDFGGTKIPTAVVGSRGKVIGELREATPTNGDPVAVTEAVARSPYA
jgi:predicted NBD/HSP70 family sugar kinase